MRVLWFPLVLLSFTLIQTQDPAGDVLRELVETQVREWWPTAAEKRFDHIGWAPDLRTARRLALEHGRPVFLFTMDGRVNLGRC